MPFVTDMTLRLSCRAGDYLVWARFKGPFSTPESRYELAELWQLSDGDHILITSRYQDVPTWFPLHPSEVLGDAARNMSRHLQAGLDVPEEPLSGPHIVRAHAGDRLAWIGESRSDMVSHEGILALLRLDANALVIGEPLREGEDGFPRFGALRAAPPPADADRVGKAWAKVRDEPVPRSMALGSWGLGA